MRQVLLLSVALVTAITVAFGQKKAVNQAQSISKSEKADFAEARSLIQGALQDPETKDDAKTWFVAGDIEDKLFTVERMKEMLGQQPNRTVMYESLLKELPYFEKAYELDRLPDAKGKVKPKFDKDIKNILSANYLYYINAGAHYFEENDYRKAFGAFEQFLKISDMPLFTGDKIAERDSNYMTVRFYTAVAATQLNEPETAIATLRKALEPPSFRTVDVYQYLYNEYEQLKDSANQEAILKEGMTQHPTEPFFLLNLINIYIYSQRNAEAVEYLHQAIAQDPTNAMLHNALGSVYEDGFKDSDKALANFTKAVELDPEYVEAVASLGRLYYNQAISLQGEANSINDNAEYQKALSKAKDLFRKALPYFEKAHKAKPDEFTYMIALRGIYYNLNMGKELSEIEAKMEQ